MQNSNKKSSKKKVDIETIELELVDVAKRLESLKEKENLPRSLEKDIQTLIKSIDQFTNK